MSQNGYEDQILAWREDREDSIRKENGWIALAGLFWLKLGANHFGSDPSNEVQLPDRAPDFVGQFEYNGSSVTLRMKPGEKIDVNGKMVDFAVLQPDTTDEPSYITMQDVRLVVIQRGSRFGIRMWDNQRKERGTWPRRMWFDIDPKFAFPAHFTAYDRPRMAFFPDLTGEKSEFPVDGYISFKHAGKEYRLDVTNEDGGYFVRFWDPMSEREAYPTGRYILTHPDENGDLTLDFNYAYNPPCAFTDFATCVFAPEQNRLDFEVTVGERYERH